ncbi:MAG: gene transfer agent family protein [Paracoccaceae bacterium]
MANPWAGEVDLIIDGQRHVLKLTLGALAELEAGLGDDSLVALVTRFESGRYSSRDVLALIVAGLRGGGWQGRPVDLIAADIAGGPVSAAQAAAQLLVRAFTLPDAGGRHEPS